MPNIMDDVLHLEAVEHTRANHALEHATLNVLESGGLKNSLAGISGCERILDRGKYFHRRLV